MNPTVASQNRSAPSPSKFSNSRRLFVDVDGPSQSEPKIGRNLASPSCHSANNQRAKNPTTAEPKWRRILVQRPGVGPSSAVATTVNANAGKQTQGIRTPVIITAILTALPFNKHSTISVLHKQAIMSYRPLLAIKAAELGQDSRSASKTSWSGLKFSRFWAQLIQIQTKMACKTMLRDREDRRLKPNTFSHPASTKL